ncbi:MAG TPA: hypothetical protein VEI74_02630, partial [Candidatus Methylomirabilis sp.]|nr:hypothetical protein [Candidatus Methylomirabilis sp.]
MNIGLRPIRVAVELQSRKGACITGRAAGLLLCPILLISSILVVCNLGENKPVIFFEGGGMTPEEIEKIAIP